MSPADDEKIRRAVLGRRVDLLCREAMGRTARNGAPAPDYRRVARLVEFDVRLHGFDGRPPLRIQEAEGRFERLAAKVAGFDRFPSSPRRRSV